MSKIVLVTTVRNPDLSFQTFLDYHLSIGINRIVVFVDRPDQCDWSIFSIKKSVTFVPVDSTLISKLKTEKQPRIEYYDREVQVRQMSHVNFAINELCSGMDWIVHIDSDEMIHVESGSLSEKLANVPENCFQVLLPNHEAVPASLEVKNPFLEVNLFKQNAFIFSSLSEQAVARSLFVAYQNGKSCGRLSAGLRANGVHRFGVVGTKEFKDYSLAGQLSVLHYVNCGFSRYLEKYRQLGDFPNVWFGKIEISIPFHLQSRDLFLENKFEDMKSLYEEKVMLKSANLEDLIASRNIAVCNSVIKTFDGKTLVQVTKSL
jgi:hypothetical protein